MSQSLPDRPLVSLVVPVYNAMPYLLENLDAIPAQGLDASQLEVILVNDGSDDGSETVLAEYAAKHPNYRLIDQPNSGGPADPCNKGIAAVRGKYFFVVGADDVLTDGALGDLVDYAEREGSDIVLCRMAGLNGRHAPGSMFKASKADADLVGDKLYNSLTAIKLFRTELVTRSGAFNPTHLRVGSDQPFTLACYLVADKISVRADRPYVMIRKREDGKNVTSSKRSAWDYAQLVTATVSVIVDGTEPGELRDGILRRPMRGALDKALRPHFLDHDEETQEAVVQEIRAAVGEIFTPTVAAHLDPLSRLKARLALDGRTATLRDVLRWQRAGGTERLHRRGTGFALDLPEELAQQIPTELLEDVKVTGVVVLEDLEIDGTVLRLGASAHVARSDEQPDSVALRVRRRGTEDWTDLAPDEVSQASRDGAAAAAFRIALDAARLATGVWDLYVVHRYGDLELINRLGKRRSERLDTGTQRLLTADGARDIGIAYSTKGFGNLSLDIGYVVNARTGPAVRLLTALEAGEDRLWLVLAAESSDPLSASAHYHAAAEDVGEPLALLPAGEGVLAVQLSRGASAGARWLRVADRSGAAVLEIPEGVSRPRGTATAASAVRATGAMLRERALRGARRLRDAAVRRG